MPTLYADDANVIIRWLRNSEEEATYPDSPEGAVSTLTFPTEGNKPLVSDITLSTIPYLFDGTVLTKDGAPVTVDMNHPDSRKQMIDDLVALQSTIQAASTVNQLKGGVQDLRRILLTVVRNVEIIGE